MATDLGVTRPPAKLSRHLRPPGWGSHSLLVCPSEGYSHDVELVLPLESRVTGPFSGLGLPHPPPYTLHLNTFSEPEEFRLRRN